jgi:hypothetical protein
VSPSPIDYWNFTQHLHWQVGPGPLLPGQANVTQQQFYDIALAQLEELWGNYGQDNLFEICE